MCTLALLGLAGTALSAGGALVEGQQQKQMADYQAKAYEQQALADAQSTAFEQSQERHKQDLLQAQARAQAGASGVGMAGSPTEVLAANARQGQLDLDAMLYGSQLRQNNLNSQAAISRFSGKQAVTASIFNAGGRLVGGLSKIYDPAKAVTFGKSAFPPPPGGPSTGGILLMATIPLQLAQRRLDTGNAPQYPQGSPVGGAMQGLGGQLSAVAERYQQMKDQQEAFDAELARRRFKGQVAQAEDEVAANAPADGSGLHEAIYGQVDPRTGQVVKPGLFDTMFDAALPTMPESQRANFARQKETLRGVGARRMAQRQQARRDDYELAEWTKIDNISTSAIAQSDPNDTANFEAIRQSGFDLIAKIGNPLARQAAEAAWRTNTAKALVQAMIAQDPKRAVEMLGAAQVGGRTKDDTAEAVGGSRASGNSNAAAADDAGKLMPVEGSARAFDGSSATAPDDKTAIPLDAITYLKPSDVVALRNQANTATAAQLVDARAKVQLAEQNAPAVIASTGEYPEAKPTAQDFASIYGAEDGPKHFDQFRITTGVAGCLRHAPYAEPGNTR